MIEILDRTFVRYRGEFCGALAASLPRDVRDAKDVEEATIESLSEAVLDGVAMLVRELNLSPSCSASIVARASAAVREQVLMMIALALSSRASTPVVKDAAKPFRLKARSQRH